MFHATLSLDPCFKGCYPEDVLKNWGEDGPPVREGDLELIGQELDFIGINIYGSGLVRAGANGEPEVVPYPNHHPQTFFNWPVTPDGPRWASRFLQERYGKPVVITENGIANMDWVALDVKVHDPQRIDCTTRYLRGLKTWDTFGAGWTRRVVGNVPGIQTSDIGVIDRASKLAASGALAVSEIPAPRPPREDLPTGKATS